MERRSILWTQWNDTVTLGVGAWLPVERVQEPFQVVPILCPLDVEPVSPLATDLRSVAAHREKIGIPS